jgi:chromatin segregation and condensation protein Rec8/ScpA/Scc1 (kleisin family)
MTFLALLELAKMRMVKLFQARLSSNELFVERSVVEYEEVAQQLDGIEEPR